MLRVMSQATCAVGICLLVSGPVRANETLDCGTEWAVAQHSAVVAGAALPYTSDAGYLQVKAADGKSESCIFYTAYFTHSSSPGNRPITFAFNGGPGSSSTWLHLGAFGPRRVDLGQDGLAHYDPFRLTANDDSLLDVSDVVFIDPTATGYSHVPAGSPSDPFFGVKNDYKSVGQFIRQFLTKYNRWSAPKFIAGESYGGVRGALLAHYLQRDLGVNLTGIVFISPWLSTATTNFNDPGNDLAYAVFLPTYAMTAWYHKKLSPELQAKRPEELRQEVEAFAMGTYFDALVLGNELSDAERQKVAGAVAAYTGIKAEKVAELDLRVADTDFFALLFQNERGVVGRLDSRFRGGLPAAGGSDRIYDPSSTAFGPQYTAAMNEYLANDLGIKSSSPYNIFGDITGWPFDTDAQEFGVMDALSRAMLDNPALKVFVGSGYYDLAVPYAATKYNFRHLAPGQDLIKRVTFSNFDAGHMFYINAPSLKQFKNDLRTFYGPSLPVSLVSEL